MSFVNLNVLRLVGGIAIIAIGLLVAGIGIPEKLPTVIMLFGFLLSLLLK